MMGERSDILSQIRDLERQKRDNPAYACGVDAQITALCDRLKMLDRSQFKPRSVV